MKALSFLKAALLIAAIPLLFGCEKESLSELQVSSESALGKKGKQVERPFKGKLVGSSMWKPDVESGNVDGTVVPAWYPGEGQGTLTHMGKFNIFYNLYGTTTFLDPVTVLGANVPVSQFFEEELQALGITLVDSNVGLVIYDKHGNSIQVLATYITFRIINETRTGVYMDAVIVGGTGKFEDASGNFTITGYSDRYALEEPSIDVIEYNGVIVY